MPGKTSKQSNEIVARIDYLFPRESFEYTNVDKFVEDVKKDSYSGVPMALVLFADKNGNTIPLDFLRDLDSPPQGLTVSYVNVPVYYPSYEQACANGEEAQYRGSMNVTQACKRAIERAISEHYDDHRLAPDAVNGVIDRFGLERTMCVLANTIRELDWDARFNTVNKQWAAGIQIPDNPGMPFKSFYLTTIKGQKGLYALIRSYEDRSKPLRTVKPSVRGKLKEPVETPASGQTAKKKERDL